jgi:glucan 1,4-alpha-glucosidase
MIVSILRRRANLLFLILLLSAATAFSQTLAPGAPGRDAQWATAGKQGVGSSANVESKVWFTLAQGVLTEVYYPDVTVANVHLLQFVVVNPKTKKVETEQDDAVHQIKVLRPDSLTFQQINTAKSGEWKITKTYATDPERDSVLIEVQFQTKNKDLNLYVYYDPSIGNSGMGDEAVSPAPRIVIGENSVNKGVPITESLASTKDFGLQASDGEIFSALMFSSPISEMTNGYYQTSDGLEQLRKNGRISQPNWRAEKGNVVQMAKIDRPQRFTTILSFAKETDEFGTAFVNARDSREKGFAKVLAEYEKGWADYVKTIRKVEPKYQAQFNMAAMQLKIHEDKTVRGANIASLSVPWGGGANANEANIGGYHLVWSRDLYQVATAFMALGDKAAAMRALDFLFKVQQKPDGSFPQNSYLDGRPFWGSLQHDEVAFPLIMAYQLGVSDKATYENHVKKAADFIVRTGPKTPQERWEEESGFSPSTIAAEIAGLVCAADIARKNGDEASATIYLATADDWARKIEMWTATTTGKYGDGNYYLRITQNGKPDAGEKIELNNGAGFFDEREIVDAGFLELVRLGIKPANDPLIQKSLKVIDEVIRVQTPNGDGFYRYNNDGYGEMDDGRRWNWDGKYTGKGRLWALLSGERGQYELALHLAYLESYNNRNFKRSNNDANEPKPPAKPSIEYLEKAQNRLRNMAAFANEGLMIPEQVWDKPQTPKNIDKQFVPELKFGEGTGSATPLAWSMAQFIRLAVNLQAGRNLDTPEAVYNRYKNGIPGQTSGFGGTDGEVVLPVNAGEKFTFSRRAPKGTKIGYVYAGKTNFVEVGADEKFTVEIVAPEREELAVVGVLTPDGSSAFERVKVRAADKTEPQKFAPAVIEKIKAAKTNPLIENGKAILVYRGAAKQVLAAGDFSGWNANVPLTKIEAELFAREFDFASNARVEYKLVADEKWIEDPLNPNSLDNGVGGRNSFFAMPDYKPNESAKGAAPPLEEFEMPTRKFGARKIKVFLPAAYKNSNARFPVLYMQDGSEYYAKAGAAIVQNNLVAQGKIKPFIIVFVDPRERMKEYFASDEWADFMANELVPEIDKRFRTIQDRDARATLGASLGGITSLWIGLRHPDKFARLGGQSSSFWADNERVVKALEKLDAAKTKFTFYLDDGTLEGAEDTRRVNVMLRGKGFPVTYIEGATGHNWTSWRDRLADAFVALWK